MIILELNTRNIFFHAHKLGLPLCHIQVGKSTINSMCRNGKDITQVGVFHWLEIRKICTMWYPLSSILFLLKDYFDISYEVKMF